MTVKQFWHEEPELIIAYHKAYYRRLHTEAHMQGQYNFIAFSTALANAFRKKGEIAHDYLSKPFDPFEKKLTEKEVLQKSRRQTQRTIGWLNSISKN